MNHAASRITILLAVVMAIALAAWFFVRQSSETPPVLVDPGEARPRQAIQVPGIPFTDVTFSAGIRFRHTNGATDRKLLPETMGSGVAFFDYDNDGRPDLFFVNSCPWPDGRDNSRPTQALYRNKGDGTFEDVTVATGLDITLFGMGVTVGDYDNDGWPDLFVTGIGGNRLLRNEDAGSGKRRFRDVTSVAGVGGSGGWPAGLDKTFRDRSQPLCFSTSAAFLDYDGDGWLDLFVCNYITWSPTLDLAQGFKLTGLGRAFGPPTAFEGSQCFLYRNKGDGTFDDVSAVAGIQVWEREGLQADTGRRAVGKSLGVAVCDVDGDGWPDIIVANDTVRNFFFHNVLGPQGTRRFEEMGLAAGVAYAEGRARGAMGIDWAPNCRDGRGLLAIGNFANEPNTLLSLEDQKSLQFVDVALTEGVAGPSRSLLKFGVVFFDYDLDGREDLVTCNGHLEPEIAQVQRGQSYAQPAQLFWNTGRRARGFEIVSEQDAGPDLFKPLVGRGCAFADIDGDGDLDLVFTANGNAPRLLRNDGATGHHWLRLRLEGDGRRSNRSAIGARVQLIANGQEQWREVASSRGYLSQSELTVTFGLGQSKTVDRVTIYWPGQKAQPQTLTGLAVNREHVIRQADRN
jgi:hypothetical protein